MEGSNEGTPPKTKIHQRDLAAVEWARTPEAKETKPQQLVGELIAGGAKVKIDTHSITGIDSWKPRITTAEEELLTEGRKMVFLAGDFYVGGRYGLETLRVGLAFAHQLSEPKYVESLFVVPYLKFTQDGAIDPKSSLLLLFRQQQVLELNRMIRELEISNQPADNPTTQSSQNL